MSELIKFLKKKYVLIAPLLIIIFIAQNEQYSQLTSSGTFGSALRPVSYTHLTLPTNREV